MIYIIIGIILVFIVSVIAIYNHLVKMNIRCHNAWSGIDNQLKRRADLIPNLVEVTKGYAKHESETLIEVVNKRNGNLSVEETANNSKEVSNSLNRLFAISESYPELKANELFGQLQIELVGTEDKIAYARQFYNDCVQQFNSSIMIFPNNLLANIMKYKEKPYFQIGENEKENIKVNL